MRLFVGQIPREWTEQDVHSLFAPFGELQETTILRHPDTFVSKGCAFVTFARDESAVQAIEALHDKYSPSEGRKIQVRDSAAPRTTTETGRLYCSNLAESTNGDQLFELFSSVGRVLSVSVLSTPWNRPKCSCLVEMASRADALAVIAEFHGRCRLPGAAAEMSVTWARNNGSKNKSQSGISAATPFPHQVPVVASSATGFLSSAPHPSGFLQSAPSAPQHVTFSSATPLPSPMYAQSAPTMSYYSSAAASPLPTPYYHPGPTVYYEDQSQQQQLVEEKSEELSYAEMHAMQAMNVQYPVLHPTPSFVFVAVPVPSHPHTAQHLHHSIPPQSPLVSPKKGFARHRSSSSIISSPSSRYREGPPGANLFVKNFPLDWDSKELNQLFEKYGEIVSCNVFLDRSTGKSRGFGFVSFGSREHAQMAIQHLNGLIVQSGMIEEGQQEPQQYQLVVEVKLKESHGGLLKATNSAASMMMIETEDDSVEELRVL